MSPEPTPNRSSATRPVGRTTYYDILDLHPQSSAQDVRRAYWEKSKLYHPDTTTLPTNTAKEKFQQLNEAYATLSNPEQRGRYDQQLAETRAAQLQATKAKFETKFEAGYNRSTGPRRISCLRSAYIDPGDRPLSAGEIFALFILGLTLLGCLLLAIFMGLTRGEVALQTLTNSPALSSLVSPRSSLPVEPIPATASSLPSSPLKFKLETTAVLTDHELLDHEQDSPAAAGNTAVQPSPAPN